MKRYLFLLLVPILALTTSCNKPSDGIYLTYKIKSEDSRFENQPLVPNEELSTFLKSRLQEKKYDVKFNEKFVTMLDISENDETILTKEETSGKLFYSTTINKGRQVLSLKLYPDSKDLILVVDLEVPGEVSFIPTQTGASMGAVTRYGRAVCYLSKAQ